MRTGISGTLRLLENKRKRMRSGDRPGLQIEGGKPDRNGISGLGWNLGCESVGFGMFWVKSGSEVAVEFIPVISTGMS
jgi:hypothetical protein